ncbi:MAG: hypothetical protein K8U57_37185 [Planctomycetes bacterium]|nr:hypothetical protein [Planctomycetota bacterium]
MLWHAIRIASDYSLFSLLSAADQYYLCAMIRLAAVGGDIAAQQFIRLTYFDHRAQPVH